MLGESSCVGGERLCWGRGAVLGERSCVGGERLCVCVCVSVAEGII